jgi:hypothetical protein
MHIAITWEDVVTFLIVVFVMAVYFEVLFGHPNHKDKE